MRFVKYKFIFNRKIYITVKSLINLHVFPCERHIDKIAIPDTETVFFWKKDEKLLKFFVFFLSVCVFISYYSITSTADVGKVNLWDTASVRRLCGEWIAVLLCVGIPTQTPYAASGIRTQILAVREWWVLQSTLFDTRKAPHEWG